MKYESKDEMIFALHQRLDKLDKFWTDNLHDMPPSVSEHMLQELDTKISAMDSLQKFFELMLVSVR